MFRKRRRDNPERVIALGFRQVRVIEAPPSTSEAVPVTKLASSEAR
jgi:hypothetical protein